MSKRITVRIDSDDIKAAKKYAGFNELTDPNDYDERYYRKQDCEKYDAFIAGIRYYKTKNLN